jgi:hypothetical protein
MKESCIHAGVLCCREGVMLHRNAVMQEYCHKVTLQIFCHAGLSLYRVV